MHQPIDTDEVQQLSPRDLLIQQKNQALQTYRHAVKWACGALEYKRKFEREEDFGNDGLRESLEFLKKDSRREVKAVATSIKVLRDKINGINKKLMDLSRESIDE